MEDKDETDNGNWGDVIPCAEARGHNQSNALWRPLLAARDMEIKELRETRMTNTKYILKLELRVKELENEKNRLGSK